MFSFLRDAYVGWIDFLRELFQKAPDWVFVVSPWVGFALGSILAAIGTVVVWRKVVRDGVLPLKQLVRDPVWVANAFAGIVGTIGFFLILMTGLCTITGVVLAQYWGPKLWIILVGVPLGIYVVNRLLSGKEFVVEGRFDQ